MRNATARPQQFNATAESMPRHFHFTGFSIGQMRHDMIATIAPMV